MRTGEFGASKAGAAGGFKLGFTLIEVLVVVAIIAVLVAVLLPSLAAARHQARLVTCQANAKQIATMTAAYQVDARGRVPVMFNYWVGAGPGGNQVIDGQDTAPVRTLLLSVALRGYAQDRRKLPPQFNPEKYWYENTVNAYQNSLLPEYYICPFLRDKGKGLVRIGTRTVKGASGSPRSYGLWEYEGRHESYQTWMWARNVIRGEVPGDENHSEVHPNDPIDGRPKYSALSWNRFKRPPRCPDGYGFDSLQLKNAHRDWTADARDRYLKSGGLSDLTVLHCFQGEMLDFGYNFMNPGSHRRSGAGGTNVVFADSHVGWVKGTQVGWP